MHVWLSLDNAVRIAENIEKAYAALDPAHAAVYRANREALSREFTALEQEVKRELAPYAGAEFYVYHPAFGYFAHMTGLGQAAIDAGLGSDVSLLLAITVISTLFVFLGNLVANVLYGVIDPQIRRGRSHG